MKNLFFISALFVSFLATGQEGPDNYLKARALMIRQEYDSAIYLLTLAEKENPGNTILIFNRGICYFELKEYNQAIGDFIFVNKRRSGMASLMLSKTETRLNHQELAVKYLKEHLSSSYRLPEKEILMDEDFIRLENNNSWKSLWKEKEWYTSNDKKLAEAVYLKINGEFPEAINLLKDLEKRGFKRTLIYQYLAEIYIENGNTKLALENLESAIKADSRNMEALKQRIDLLTSLQEYEKAKPDCDRLLRQSPEEFEYYLVSAKINSKLGAYNQGIEEVNFYLELFPNSDKAYNELGLINFENGKYLNAIKAFNRSLELDKGRAEYYYNRGKVYAATKTFKYAEQDFSMSLDLDPKNAEAWYEKGKVDLELGKKDSACFDFKKAAQYGKFEAREFVERLCGKSEGYIKGN